MTPEQVAEILLVQAAEEVEPAALPPEARIDALEAAGDLDDERAWFARRARHLLGHELAARRPLLRVREALAPGLGWNLALPGLLGALSNALGPHEQIRVLYNPIVGLVGWSLAVYLGLGVLALRTPRLRAPELQVPAPPLPRAEGGFLARALRRAAARLWLRALRTSAVAREQASAWLAVGTRFFELWERAARPWFALRTSRMLHLGALGLALGAIAGTCGRRGSTRSP